MKITRRDYITADNSNEKLIELNNIRIKCDCDNLFETTLKTTIILKPDFNVEQETEFKYCPYCGKKIKFEELNEYED